MGVREEYADRLVGRRRSTKTSRFVVSVALRTDPFVARRRLYFVDARTTTLLDAEEQKHGRPRRPSETVARTAQQYDTRLFDLRSDEITR